MLDVGFFQNVEARKLLCLSLLCICVNFDQYWSLYGQLLLYAYHVKFCKAYVKLAFTCKATANR